MSEVDASDVISIRYLDFYFCRCDVWLVILRCDVFFCDELIAKLCVRLPCGVVHVTLFCLNTYKVNGK